MLNMSNKSILIADPLLYWKVYEEDQTAFQVALYKDNQLVGYKLTTKLSETKLQQLL